jgi:hypothetical protein
VTSEAAPESFGPFVATLEPAEAEAAAARYGLRAALRGGLTASHHAPLAAFVLTLLFAAILALTGFISRRAGELTFLIAAAAFMIQRLVVHRRIWRARARGRAEVERFVSGGEITTSVESDAVSQTTERESRRLAFADCEEAEEAGGLIYLWRREGAPVVMPCRALPEGEAARFMAFVKPRIGRSRPV